MPMQKHTLSVLGGAAAAGAITGLVSLAVMHKAVSTVSDLAEDAVDAATDKVQDVMSINSGLLALGAVCTAALVTAACINNVATLAEVGKGVADHVKAPQMPQMPHL